MVDRSPCPVHMPNVMSPPPQEAGFAIYAAMGFVMLMSVLVGSVGERLNNETLKNARDNASAQTLDAALDLHHQAVVMLKGLAAPKVLPTSSSETDAATDLAACLGARVSDTSIYIVSDKQTIDGATARYFVARVDEGSGLFSFTIFGCAFEDGIYRAAESRWEHDSLLDDFELVSLLQY